jgi:AcrR family transcriptional regulator
MTDIRGPVRDTRAAILEVAGELFAEKGYDATSLREISERLAITKAALYYHFRSKDDIMRALLAPMDDIVSELLERLEAARDVDGFADALTWLVGMIFEHVAFFRLLERNRHSMEALDKTFHELEGHLELHERVRSAVHAVAGDVAEEIRMFAALGAVTAFDDWAPKLLADGPHDVIQRELCAAVHAILRT